MTEPHRVDIRVYYEDTDVSGIVYHANYLKFMERGRTEWLRSLGHSHAGLFASEDPVAFAVRRLSVAFEKPARIDDLLTVETRLTESSGVRLILDQTILRQADLLITAEVEIVCLSPSGRPRRLPAGLGAVGR